MKNCIKNRLLLPALIAALNLLPARPAAAQTFTTLYNFTNSTDGGNPFAGLVLSGGTLYGTACYGGTSGEGAVFAINTDGNGFTNLYSFTGGSDGANPRCGLVVSGKTLFGTTFGGGTSGKGTVFAVNTNGSGFTNLYRFLGYPTDGASPYAGLIVSNNVLYGTTESGGTWNGGMVFAVNINGTANGTGYTNLYNFTDGDNDGGFPYSGLILSGNTLYGTTSAGGSSGAGTVFEINVVNMVYTNLHSFSYLDGYLPKAGLVLSGNTLYGTATADEGVSGAKGTVFAFNTGDLDLTNLYDFTNSTDGNGPYAGLVLSGNTLYGTTVTGGSFGQGTVFAVHTDGTDYTNLHSFTAVLSYPNPPINSDGAQPYGGLVLSGNTLYGTTLEGGSMGSGTVFSLTLGSVSVSPPQLAIMLSGTNVILTWPANFTGFTLEFATNLVPPAVWNTNLPAPVAVNQQNTVTNAISDTQRFYRLSQ